MKQYKDQTQDKVSVAEITQGPRSRIFKMAVYEVLVSVIPSVHVVQAQVQASQTKKIHNSEKKQDKGSYPRL